MTDALRAQKTELPDVPFPEKKWQLPLVSAGTTVFVYGIFENATKQFQVSNTTY